MRTIVGFVVVSLLVGAGFRSVGQTCTGLCLQQVMSCPNGGTTTISGTVYTPNGTDPLPNALVYIPNAPVDAFTPGVSCPAAGAAPSGSPLVGTATAVDGTFTITNVPVGTNIPLVVVAGRWRRQVVVPTTTACTNTAVPADSTRMPRNQSEGDIPKIAIATGSADQVECVLRKVGISDSEFTDPTGTGRINLYLGQHSAGAQASPSTPSETDLMGTSTTTNQYDVIMLPCQGGTSNLTGAELQDFVNFANSGGRVYSSHYSYDYMYQNPNLPTVANWNPGESTLPNTGTATVDTSFSAGETLAQWLQLVGATTTLGQMQISTLKHDMDGVIAPTQSWLTLNDASEGNPVMQFVYNAPVGAANQCGRVLFNEYHVENPPGNSTPKGDTFPAECSNAAMTPQEKLLEYSLFELTNDGGGPTLAPTTGNFGNVALGFTSTAQVFTWTNNSTFPATATASTSGPYAATASGCTNVQGGGSCTISVVFTPTVLGTQTGTLTVNSTGPATSASLTGVGVPALVFSVTSLQFGSHDVGSTTTMTVTVTNDATGSVATPAIVTTGDYAASSNCGSAVAVGAQCTISVAFMPTMTGDRSGTLTVGGYAPIALDGNGVDFTIALLPTSGTVEAGLSVGTKVTEMPIAGFAAGLTQSCTTTAPATTCTVTATVNPSSAVTTAVTIQTTPEYVIVGYSGFGARGWIWLVGAASGLMLLVTRRRAARVVLALLMVCAIGGVSGCSGKQPAKNAVYTPAGSYTVTVSATDGFLVHSADFALKVTAP